jgi:prepilin-type N-terminal cleavage/methylation domain-containing protein
MKRAFTLIELLVAISVIVVLAGITIPVIGVVRKQAKDAQCRNNLKQLFTGITGFRLENNQAYPATLRSLFAEGQALAGESSKLLLCPHDGQKGQDQTCARNPLWDTPYAGELNRLHETDCSYFFEVSGKPLGVPEANWPLEDGDTDPLNNPKWLFIDTSNPSNNRTTWWQAKAYQLRKGNFGMTAFDESDFPIIRCFHHHFWKSSGLGAKDKKVMNLAWDGTIFLSIPYWEHQANPNIPLPY